MNKRITDPTWALDRCCKGIKCLRVVSHKVEGISNRRLYPKGSFPIKFGIGK